MDTLAVVGCPVSSEDHIEAILDGLYKATSSNTYEKMYV